MIDKLLNDVHFALRTTFCVCVALSLQMLQQDKKIKQIKDENWYQWDTICIKYAPYFLALWNCVCVVLGRGPQASPQGG